VSFFPGGAVSFVSQSSIARLYRMNTGLKLFDGVFIIPVLQVFWAFFAILGSPARKDALVVEQLGNACDACRSFNRRIHVLPRVSHLYVWASVRVRKVSRAWHNQLSSGLS
jgi:hypothetical protein